jgi:hypothetical protein
MSERFSDEVLQRVIEAYESACWAPAPTPDAPVVCVVPDRPAGYAAMRAVLEGRLEEIRLETVKQYELSRKRMEPLEAKIREQERAAPPFRDSGVRIKGNVVLVSNDPEVNAFLDRMGGIVAVNPEQWK